MAWTPKDLMDLKREFVEFALQEGANRRELCRRFGISPKTGYALLARYALEVLRFASQRNCDLTPKTNGLTESAMN